MKLLLSLLLTIVLSVKVYCQTTDRVKLFDDKHTIEESQSVSVDTDTLLIGPNAELNIKGRLEILSTYILIAPGAKIEGTGVIFIGESASKKGYPTIVDGNGNAMVNIKMEIANKANLVLGSLTHDRFEGLNLESNDFYNDSSLILTEDGVCIELRGHRLRLGLNATIEQVSPNRMVISGNDVNSVLSKKMNGGSTFAFPIGLREGDYSPAILTTERTSELFVSLLSFPYTGKELTFATKENGIDRIWGVHADHNVRVTYIFEYNGDDTKARVAEEDVEVFQYSEKGKWNLMTTTVQGIGQHSVKNLASMERMKPQNYFSKFAKFRSGPQSNDDFVRIGEDKSVIISILKNDRAGEGKILSEKVKLVETPKNGFAELLSNGDVRYQPVPGFTGTDLFTYEVIDEFGLKSISSVYITVEGEGLLILSNVLTPNGDGYNDNLVFIAKEKFVGIELIILNRWGDRLYESKAYNNNWDGTGLSAGTYYYIVKATRQNGEFINEKGWLLLNK